MATAPNASERDSEFDQWYEAFTGLATMQNKENQKSPQREGELMRKLLLYRLQNLQNATVNPIAMETNWTRILQRARHDKLFEPGGHTQAQMNNSKAKAGAAVANQSWYAVVAVVAMMGIGIALQQPTSESNSQKDDLAVMRGDEQPQQIVVSNIEFMSRIAQIEAVLGGANLPYILNRTAISAQFQTKIPADSAVEDKLYALGVQVPAHRRLNVIIKSSD